MRLIASLLLCLLAGVAGAAVTTVNCSPQQSVSPFNHVTQVAISATEQQVTLSISQAGYWVSVEVYSPVAWTYRGTTGSSTDAKPILANQVLIIWCTGLGMTFYPVGSGAGTLYVTPVQFGRAPSP